MKRDNSGYIYLLVTIVLFSTYEVVSKTLVGKVDSFQINFIRFFIGGIILLVFTALKRDFKISRNDFTLVAMAGIINVVISMNLLQLSLYVEGAKASVVAVLFSSNPIFVSIFAIFLEKEKLKLYRVVSLVIGVAGIVTVFINKFDISVFGSLSPLLALLSAIFYGLYTVLGRKAALRIGSLKMNSYSFIMGSLSLVPVLLLIRRPVLHFATSGLPQVIYLSFFLTGIAYLSYFKGLSITGASSGSLVFFIKPVLASLLAIVFLGERATVNLIVGALMIISGIAVNIYWDKIKKIRKIAGF